MKRSVTYSVLAAAIFSALSFPAFAADNADSNVTTKDVIVTATRTEQEVKNVPNTVEVITQEDIQKTGATDIYSALRLADDINIINDSTGFSKKISIRGMETNQSLILINGRRVAGEDTPTLQNGSTLGRINLANVERIEIIRGAASAQYGSDALSGVINIITKKGDRDASVTVGANASNRSQNNYYNIDFGKQGNFSGNLNINFGKDRNVTSEGSSTGYLYGPTQNYDFSGTWDFDDNHSLTFDAGYYKAKQKADWSGMDGMATGYKYMTMLHAMTLHPGDVAFMFAAAQKYADTVAKADLKQATMESTQKDFALTYNGKNEKSDYSLRAYYTKLDKSRYMPYTAIIGASNWALGVDKELKGFAPENNKYTIWGIDGHDSIAINDDHLFTFGGEYNKYTVEGDNIGGDEKKVTTYAGYIQDEWMVGDKLLLIPAVRYDHHSDFGNKTTPHIGATYFLNQNNRFKANWGKGFKAPTVTDLYSDYYHSGSIIEGNPNLQPEESTNWDVGYEYDKGGTFGKITYFHNDVDNMISTRTKYTDILGNATREYYNIDGTTKTTGVELTLGRDFNKFWNVKLNSNWIDAENNTFGAGVSSDSPHSVDGIADNITTLQLNFDDNDPEGVSVSFWQQWYTNYYDSGSDTSFSYHTTNFVVNKKLGEGRRVFVGVDNLFDKKIGDINLDGRIWRVGAEWKF